jgi:hypothetical protein
MKSITVRDVMPCILVAFYGRFIKKYLNFATFSEEILAVFIL